MRISASASRPFLASAAGLEVIVEDTTATVYVVPQQNETVYTAKAVIAFDETALTVQNITFTPKWMPLSQEGYDSFVNGQIIKTAGYPKGITQKTALLTFSVTKKTSGLGVIAIEGTSALYDANGANIATSFGGATLGSVVERTAVLPPSFAISETASVEEAVEDEAVAAPIEEVTEQETLPAAVITIDGALPVVPLVVVLVIVLIGFAIYFMIRKARRQA